MQLRQLPIHFDSRTSDVRTLRPLIKALVKQKGVKVLIDAKAIMFLLGTEMDFQTNALKSGFVFNNPNQTSACGCGESVQIKPAASETVPAGA